MGLLTLVMVILGGCGSTTPSDVVIGAVYPLSGSQAATGADIQHGLEMAAEIINGKYDLDLPLAQEEGLPSLKGAKIKLVFADHAGNADQGAAEATRLIEQEKVVALIGAYNSSVTTQASQSAEAAEVPFLNPESTAASLTQRGFKWFFRTTADDTIFVQNFFDFLADLQSKKGVTPSPLAVVYENSSFGTGVGLLEVQSAPQAGWAVAADVPYAAKATSVDQEVTQIKNSGATVLMQTSYEQDAILFMQTYKAQGYRPEAILAMDAGFISPAFIKTLGDDADPLLVSVRSGSPFSMPGMAQPGGSTSSSSARARLIRDSAAIACSRCTSPAASRRITDCRSSRRSRRHDPCSTSTQSPTATGVEPSACQAAVAITSTGPASPSASMRLRCTDEMRTTWPRSRSSSVS